MNITKEELKTFQTKQIGKQMSTKINTKTLQIMNEINRKDIKPLLKYLAGLHEVINDKKINIDMVVYTILFYDKGNYTPQTESVAQKYLEGMVIWTDYHNTHTNGNKNTQEQSNSRHYSDY